MLNIVLLHDFVKRRLVDFDRGPVVQVNRNYLVLRLIMRDFYRRLLSDRTSFSLEFFSSMNFHADNSSYNLERLNVNVHTLLGEHTN